MEFVCLTITVAILVKMLITVIVLAHHKRPDFRQIMPAVRRRQLLSEMLLIQIRFVFI